MADKFRKKPVVISAEQWWPGVPTEGVEEKVTGDAITEVIGIVQTLEGPLRAMPGDYIVTGVRGERYPVKKEIFEETYERAWGGGAIMDKPNLTNTQYAQELRKLALLYEENEDLPQIYDGTASDALIFCHDKKSFATTVRVLTEAYGAGKKEDGDTTLDFIPDSPLRLKVCGFKSDICERVSTGTRLVPETVIPARPATEETVIPAHVEEVWEWKCRPFLESEEEDEEKVEA